jgi:tetratricopeptide (TPR) repeat protein
VSFLPISNLVVLSSAGYAERLLYLPFVGLALAAGAGAEALGAAARRPTLGRGVLAAVGLANSIALQQRHGDWRSAATLFSADADRLPGNSLLESNAALQAFLQHDAALALQRAYRALQADPTNVLALDVAGVALDRLGRPAEAEQAFKRGFEQSNRAEDVTQDYVRFLLRHRRAAEARAVLDGARARHPGVPVNPNLDREIDRVVH